MRDRINFIKKKIEEHKLSTNKKKILIIGMIFLVLALGITIKLVVDKPKAAGKHWLDDSYNALISRTVPPYRNEIKIRKPDDYEFSFLLTADGTGGAGADNRKVNLDRAVAAAYLYFETRDYMDKLAKRLATNEHKYISSLLQKYQESLEAFNLYEPNTFPFTDYGTNGASVDCDGFQCQKIDPIESTDESSGTTLTFRDYLGGLEKSQLLFVRSRSGLYIYPILGGEIYSKMETQGINISNGNVSTVDGTTKIYSCLGTYCRDPWGQFRIGTTSHPQNPILIPVFPIGQSTDYKFSGYEAENFKTIIDSNGYLTNETNLSSIGLVRWDSDKTVDLMYNSKKLGTIYGQGTYIVKIGGSKLTDVITYYLDSGHQQRMTSSSNNITPPTEDGKTFKGYFTQENAGGIKVIDERGYIIETSESNVPLAHYNLYAFYTNNDSGGGTGGSSKTKVTITYDADGGKVSQSSKEVTVGEAYGELAHPEKKFTISFDSNGGSKVESKEFAYIFVGWQVAGIGQVTSSTTVTKNTDHKLTATWRAPGFNLPEAPTREDYTFDGWYTSSTGGDKITGNLVNPSADTTYYAHWTKNSSSGETNPGSGGSSGGGTGSSTGGSGGGTTPGGTGGSQGNTGTGGSGSGSSGGSSGSTSSGNQGGTGSGSTSNPTVVKYIVTFNSNGGSNVSSQTVENGSKITKPTNPTKAGDEFIGWYKESAFINEWNFDKDIVASDVTLFAKWKSSPAASTDPSEIKYMITFSDEGNVIATSMVKTGGKIIKPDDPAKNGYLFDGWYTDSSYSSKWDFDDDIVSKDITLYAKWIKDTSSDSNSIENPGESEENKGLSNLVDNPKTGDINLPIVIGGIVVSVLVLGLSLIYIIKNRKK